MLAFLRGRNRARRAATVARFYRRLAQTFEVADVSERPGGVAAPGGWVILSISVMDCQSFGVYTLILLSLQSFSAEMTSVAPG